MDVMLIEDKSISRDRHCSVVYDPKGNVFFIFRRREYRVSG